MYAALLDERKDTIRIANAASDYLKRFEEREAEVRVGLRMKTRVRVGEDCRRWTRRYDG